MKSIQLTELKKVVFSIIGLLFLFQPISTFAQAKSKVKIRNADSYKYNVKIGKDIQRLIGNVVIVHDSVIFSCDSAYLDEAKNSFEAFNNVHIKVNDTVDVYGGRLYYDGNTKIAELFDSVKLIDKNTILYTDHLIYNRKTKTAYYDQSGRIINSENVLTSKQGLYFTSSRTFHFRKDVVLATPDQETYSDTLVYNTNNETAYFIGPTLMRGKDNMIYCENGWYDTKNDVTQLKGRPFISNERQTISADSIFYDNNTTFGKAMGHVRIVDTLYQIILSGKKGELWDEKGKAYVTDSALAITYDNNDSLFIHSDTMWMFFDKERKARMMKAYYRVRFYRTNLQGKCDSMAYNMSDSAIRLYNKPVLWSDENQLSSDSIAIIISGSKVDSLLMYNTAFIVSRDSTNTYNQIRGKNMAAFFNKNQLSRINVNGNAQTIYYVREEDGYLIGVDIAEASDMSIRIRNSKIRSISYFSSVNEDMYPEKQLSDEQRFLKDFTWQDSIRPRNKNDIYPRMKMKELEQ